MGWQELAAIIVVFAPALGAVIGGLGQKTLGDNGAMAVTTGLLVTAALAATSLLLPTAFGSGPPPDATITLARWFDVGSFQANWTIRIDTLSIVMMFVVTSVSSLVHIYSIGYMSHDPHRARFFAYLSLFTFAMLMLVTADNFLQLFFGWEGVGLASYLLIGFWYKKPSANSAAIKAFVTNRVGDFGFVLGIMAVFLTFGSIEFDTVFEAIKTNAVVTPLAFGEAAGAQEAMLSVFGMDIKALELAGFLLFVGAMGKSAQFLLHVWLPDAMEGPTPVSALIHAATMVTAGVVLVVRCSPIYEYAPMAATFITLIGAVTALFAATVGLAQNDIKRVVAYSTCSQLGYMFFAAGLGAYSAAMFHLFTHAFFKALLFLTAGAVIHGLHDEQDLRKMGGLRTKMPIAWLMMLLGTLALTGVGIPGTKIGFAGFFSKDVIIEMAFLDGGVYGMFAFYCGIAAAVLTSFYSWRLMLMTFHGKTRAPQDHYDHAHDAPSVMGVPLYLLAAGAVFAGALFYSPFIGKLGEQNEKFWGDAIYVTDAGGHGAHAEHGDDHVADDHSADDAHAAEATHADDHHSEDAHGDDAHGDDAHGGHHVPTWVLWAPFFAWVGGLLFALYFYGLRAGLGAKIAANGGPLHSFLSNKWYFDELYNATVVKATALLGDLFWKVGDGKIIDGLGPDGVSATAKATSGRLSKLHTGYLYHYAFVILIGAVVFGGVALLGASGAE